MTVFVDNATILARPTAQSHDNMTFEQTNAAAVIVENGVGELVEKTATVFWDNNGVGGELLREDHGSGRGASFQCSNIFTIFAVLVFLFALVDFIMGMDGRRRRRRDVGGCNLEGQLGGDLEEPLAREASLAVALLWRGSLLSNSHHMDNTFFDSRTTYNTYNTYNESSNKTSSERYGKKRRENFGCSATVLCKAARSAASLGRSLLSHFFASSFFLPLSLKLTVSWLCPYVKIVTHGSDKNGRIAIPLKRHFRSP